MVSRHCADIKKPGIDHHLMTKSMNFKTLENLIKKEKDGCAEVAITT